jgi:beta-galactosidase
MFLKRSPVVASTALTTAVLTALLSGSAAGAETHTFAVGDSDFLLDGKPLQIRCGEIHLARVPREYWRNRLKLCRAMGLNTVCAYLFWNLHEPAPGQYDFSGQADAAEFCRIAKEEGLYVILRPGPYACAEWDMGGLPWWLLREADIKLRSRDEKFMVPARAYLKKVGSVLADQQVTRGGPILMVQVENEYGSYGRDAEYVRELRQATIDAGFEVPLFACNPTGDLKKGLVPELFQVVNFGSDPAAGFRALRGVQGKGPLMCGEFYPGWFDTWGAPHHLGHAQRYLADLEYMLSHGASFSIYMAHGGSSFGLWAGADRPFKPDTSSYDYDAPISESGQIGEKFALTRALFAKHLAPGEKLPDPPAANPVAAVAEFRLTARAGLLENLPTPIADASPRNMEAYDQGHGCILYRTTIPAGAAANLEVGKIGDFGWVSVDGRPVGVLDRRTRRTKVLVPERSAPARLDILVEAMGHVNFGPEVHDRKGLMGPVTLGGEAVQSWQVYPMRLDEGELGALKFEAATGQAAAGQGGPAFWKGTFTTAAAADTFLNVSRWGKGVLWVNGHCLGRFWNIGPTQTMYVPGPWLRAGENEVVVLDLLGPEAPVLSGQTTPILDQLRPELDFGRRQQTTVLHLDGVAPVLSGAFPAGPETTEIKLPAPVTARQVCIECDSAHDGKPFAAIAEISLLGPNGEALPHTNWSIPYVDSEETEGEDGAASNAIDGQTSSFWHTEWHGGKPGFPHYLVIDLGSAQTVSALRYTPRQGAGVTGRIKEFRLYAGEGLAREKP